MDRGSSTRNCLPAVAPRRIPAPAWPSPAGSGCHNQTVTGRPNQTMSLDISVCRCMRWFNLSYRASALSAGLSHQRCLFLTMRRSDARGTARTARCVRLTLLEFLLDRLPLLLAQTLRVCLEDLYVRQLGRGRDRDCLGSVANDKSGECLHGVDAKVRGVAVPLVRPRIGMIKGHEWNQYHIGPQGSNE